MRRSRVQPKLPPLLSFDIDHGPVSDPLVGLAVQGDPDREPGRAIVTDQLNAGDRLATRPTLDGFQALLAET